MNEYHTGHWSWLTFTMRWICQTQFYSFLFTTINTIDDVDDDGCRAWVDRMSSAFAREHNKLFYYSECRMEWTIVEWDKTRQWIVLLIPLLPPFTIFFFFVACSLQNETHKSSPPEMNIQWVFCQMQLTAIGQRRVNSFLDAELNSFVANTFAMGYAIAPINSNSLYDEQGTDRPLRVRIAYSADGHATLVCQ